MFGEGVFVSDPGFSNQGLDKDGSVKFTDVGSARTKFPNNMDYSNVALCRALTHYTAYYMIRSICWGMKTSSGISFNDLYAKVVGFEPRTIPSASSTREILRNRFAPQVSLALAKAGDEEFKRFASNGAPFDLYTEFLQNLPKSLLWKQ
ncbi:MAG: hypothetical protein A3G15_01345 [Candidatus Levybacteria bacterium RIFCSPLOWO2_12_FULL_40_10]|nr:MAG: hypothetical protein A3G15_01345 [Candidatus Levybacteria bacterium RIFCSPLOWO2_12_FULL_40_10]